MSVKVLILGRPGSGKTTAYYFIEKLLQSERCNVRRLRDYTFLRRMFEQERESGSYKRFRPTAHDGFDVTDFSVLKEVLVDVECEVSGMMSPYTHEKDFILVELARGEYSTALSAFSPEFLSETNILFIDADLETCAQRICERVTLAPSSDNHYVSDNILKNYYGQDNRNYMEYQFKNDHHVERVVRVIENISSFGGFRKHVEQFVEEVLKMEQEKSALYHLIG